MLRGGCYKSGMTVSTLGWARRGLSAVVCLAGLALVLARTRGGDEPNARYVGYLAAGIFVLSLLALIDVARRENLEAERAAASRERQRFELLKFQFLHAEQTRAGEEPISSSEAEPMEDAESVDSDSPLLH
jgi:hypothetical protein